MKKTALILSVTILISCGSSENKSSDINTNDVNTIETVEKEKIGKNSQLGQLEILCLK